MVTKDCEKCGKTMQARQADINRGWGKFCSKSCKAKKQTKKANKQTNREFYKPRDYRIYDDLEDVGHPLASGFFGHGQDT